MRAVNTLASVTGLFLVAAVTPGQAPAKQEFEAASVKPFAPNPPGGLPGFPIGIQGGPGTADPGRIRFTNYTLKYLFTIAFDVKNCQISCPDWIDSNSARFVIEATIRPGATKEQVN
jgi:uncharacterized protein (TIGR03435 family)